MLPVEIDTPLRQLSQFDEETNKVKMEYAIDLIDKLREVAHVQEFAPKHRAARRYNLKSSLERCEKTTWY